MKSRQHGKMKYSDNNKTDKYYTRCAFDHFAPVSTNAI